MPTYRVTDSQTGRTLRLTGDSPPTEEELQQIFDGEQQSAAAASPSPAPTNPFMQALGVAGKVLNPLAPQRQALGDMMGQQVQTGKQIFGATGLGRLLQASTIPPIKTAVDYATGPQMVGSMVREAANPWAWLGVKTAEPAIEQASQATTTAGRNAANFLKGNPEGIQQAEEATHNVVQSVRQGGELHKPFFDQLGVQADRAWEPMRQVSASIEAPISVDEVAARLTEKFAHEQGRAQEAINALRSAAGTQQTFSAPELVDLSSQLGSQLPKNVLRGMTARNRLQQFVADARSGIADVLERQAPEELKGAVGQAKQQWANYAADRDRLFQLFKPGAAPNQETKAGIQFVKRMAEQRLTPSEQQFLDRVGMQFPDLGKALTEKAQQMQKALGIGRTGAGTSVALKKVLPSALSTGAAGLLLKYMLGRGQGQRQE